MCVCVVQEQDLVKPRVMGCYQCDVLFSETVLVLRPAVILIAVQERSEELRRHLPQNNLSRS